MFDVIVVGGGHAGTEAALAAARMNAKTLLLTHNIETIGQMSCNPAIGGIGKSHLVKEVDAMGGAMAQAIDIAGIQFRKLNRSKGPAVQSTRVQADRVHYKQAIRSIVEQQKNLTIKQGSVDDLIIEKDVIKGLVLQDESKFFGKAIILTVGTFLGGEIHVGDEVSKGGRVGDPAATSLACRLRELPLRVARLKTGTPPRLDMRTIDFSKLVSQPGDEPLPYFSIWNKPAKFLKQMPCHIAYTNERTHEIILKNLDRSAMYSGNIEGVGPRYCPSIEDKLVRFADKQKHQVFLEPEGLVSNAIYPNGISTSLPLEVQIAFVNSIDGLEKAKITQVGYAIEYDYFDPRDLLPTLETRAIKKLFFAGQINGTTGYEEAAAQGLLSGINAACVALDKETWYPLRSEAYLGVLIDDLITQGTTEPYRMFTSRAEYRLRLREDNADLRLTPKARELGLIDDNKWEYFEKKKQAISNELNRLDQIIVHPDTEVANKLNQLIPKPLEREYHALELLKRPELSYETLAELLDKNAYVDDPKVIEQVENQAKYAGYIARQDIEIARSARNENLKLTKIKDFSRVKGLSLEVCEKLNNAKPYTLGQAARVPGVTPAAVSLLLIHLKKI